MSVLRDGGRVATGVAAIVAVLTFGAVAGAAEQASRYGAVISARIEMQRQLGEWLTKSLQGPAEPYRVEAVVRVELRGMVREMRAKQQSAAPAVKIGGKSKVKLPGLGMVDGGGQGGPLLPEINIEGGTRVTEQVSRQLETEVTKLSVILFVDPVMPKERRELLSRLAGDLTGIDRSRGDEVLVEERPALPPPVGPVGPPTVVSATITPPPKLAYEIIAVCATTLLAAAILAWGLSRRSAIAAGVNGRGGAELEERREVVAAASAAIAAADAEAVQRRRKETGAFQALAGAKPDEIVQVVADVDPNTAIAIVDLFGLDDEAARLLAQKVPPQRRSEIGVGLASPRILAREHLAQMESIAGQALERVRNRVALGGPSRLAELLARAPAGVRGEMLQAVAARDPGLARAARAELVLFDDLAGFDDASVRRVVTGIDPAQVAIALVGADAAREVVLGAVSKRLRAILETEVELVVGRPPAEIEEARRIIEQSMRALHARGDLHLRASAEPPAEAA
jgi:flagellar motor switch protein FliG